MSVAPLLYLSADDVTGRHAGRRGKARARAPRPWSRWLPMPSFHPSWAFIRAAFVAHGRHAGAAEGGGRQEARTTSSASSGHRVSGQRRAGHGGGQRHGAAATTRLPAFHSRSWTGAPITAQRTGRSHGVAPRQWWPSLPAGRRWRSWARVFREQSCRCPGTRGACSLLTIADLHLERADNLASRARATGSFAEVDHLRRRSRPQLRRVTSF